MDRQVPVVASIWKLLGSQQGAGNSTSRHGQKVRTGCAGCKAARVKCNEDRPACSRCRRRKTACVYPSVTHRTGAVCNDRRQLQPRPLLPAGSSGGGSSTGPATACPIVRITVPPGAVMKPWDGIYYETFRHRVILQLGDADGEFWRRTVLRESTRDTCIHSAILALGALARAQEQRAESSSRVPLCKMELGRGNQSKIGATGPDHYYPALAHYTRAIGQFRSLIATANSGRPSTTRSILIATVLFVAFEVMQGNTSAADQLGAYSVSLLRDTIMEGSLSGKRNGGDNESIIQPYSESLIAGKLDDDGVSEAEVALVRNTIFSSGLSPVYTKGRQVLFDLPMPSFYGAWPPGPEASRKVFSRLWERCIGLSALWYIRAQSTMHAVRGGNSDGRRRDGIPTADLPPRHHRERREILSVIAAWQSAVRHRLVVAARNKVQQGHDNPLEQGDNSPDAVYEHYWSMSVVINHCHDAMLHVFDSSSRSWESDDYSLSQIDAILSSAARRRRRAEGEGPVITTLPPSVAGTSSSSATESPSPRIHCVGQEGLMSVLAQTAQENRHPATRRRAMELWGRMVDGHSHWDVQSAYLGAMAVMQVEEEELRDKQREPRTGAIPLEYQYFWSSGSWNDDYSEFQAVLTAKVPGLDGIAVQRTVAMPALHR
ncbi:uncharacterized protein B0I36DRAFT_436311 [Microdochium trichocladiopsis]|uniref:Zn(2)-C6 fungal-type domain-containing protein n=1 Tax=Microdochium trichocladiopsis TaxID=1682393 RepID=A0A9P9BJ41_9PEZI|nr:uncharacterized protein B0I36DRAFT_436311 [Microdochium trichocladiopsis]KAH7014251.1 hypothetical protein B0I36DRAFT_436311 [Microdochium trichocladiopsis]